MAGSVAWTVFPDSHGKLEGYCSEHSRAVLRIKKWANDMDYGDLDWYDKRDQFQWAVCPRIEIDDGPRLFQSLPKCTRFSLLIKRRYRGFSPSLCGAKARFKALT